MCDELRREILWQLGNAHLTAALNSDDASCYDRKFLQCLTRPLQWRAWRKLGHWMSQRHITLDWFCLVEKGASLMSREDAQLLTLCIFRVWVDVCCERWLEIGSHIAVGVMLAYSFNDDITIIMLSALQALALLYIIYYHEHHKLLNEINEISNERLFVVFDAINRMGHENFCYYNRLEQKPSCAPGGFKVRLEFASI